MEKSYIGRYGFLIAFVVMVHAGMAWSQPNDTTTANRSSHEDETSPGCSIVMINAQRPPTKRILVAEDMRCQQCRGKCTAENLRCRSQCSGDSACLAQCEERSSKCETMCKQIFQCE
jgi:hypothetical protein